MPKKGLSFSEIELSLVHFFVDSVNTVILVCLLKFALRMSDSGWWGELNVCVYFSGKKTIKLKFQIGKWRLFKDLGSF